MHTDWTAPLTLTGFLLFRVGNTGIPGVWLFHTGNRYSFDNIVPASIGGLLATPPSGGHRLSLVISVLFFSFTVKVEKTPDSFMVSASRTPPPLSTPSLTTIQTPLLTLITRRKETITL